MKTFSKTILFLTSLVVLVSLATPAKAAVPTITSTSPRAVGAGAPFATLYVYGTNFERGSVVQWNEVNKETAFNYSERIEAEIPESDLATTGTFRVRVVNPGGQISNVVMVQVVTPPVTTSVSPISIPTGYPDPISLIINGSGFNATSRVTLFGTGSLIFFDAETIFVSPYRIDAIIPSSLLSQVDRFLIRVTNITSTGDLIYSFVHAGSIFTVTYPPPVLTNISPQLAAIDTIINLHVYGSNFTSPYSTINFNNLNYTTNFVDSGHLRTLIPRLDNDELGEIPVKVVDNRPYGASSGIGTITVAEFTVLPSDQEPEPVDNSSTQDQLLPILSPEEIARIYSQIASLQKQLNEQLKVAYQVPNQEIKKLQIFLNNNGFPLAAAGAGSPGHETNYSGPLTREALRKFQEAHGLAKSAKSSGLFGPWTKSIIKKITGGLLDFK